MPMRPVGPRFNDDVVSGCLPAPLPYSSGSSVDGIPDVGSLYDVNDAYVQTSL